MTEKFHYTVGKKKITLPKFGNLPFGVIRKLRKEDDTEQVFLLFELILKDDPETMEIIDDMGQEELLAMMEEWQKESGVTPGESAE